MWFIVMELMLFQRNVSPEMSQEKVGVEWILWQTMNTLEL